MTEQTESHKPIGYDRAATDRIAIGAGERGWDGVTDDRVRQQHVLRMGRISESGRKSSECDRD
jgi:hypothetical protein